MKIKLSIIASLLVILSGCSGETESTLRFATTFAPVYDLVKNLTKDVSDVEINCIVGNNEPHGFSPNSAKTIGFVEKCDILFAFGRDIDTNLKKLNESKYYEITEGVDPLITDGVVDPHDWLSPVKYMKFAKNIKDKLIETNPANKLQYETNYNLTINNLNNLNNMYKVELLTAPLSSNIIVTSHEAFGHLAQEYGLIQKGIKDLANHELTTQELNEIILYIKENNVHTIFVEALDETGSVETVISELNADNYECSLAVLQAFETVNVNDENDTYLNVMNENLNVLKEYLK